MNSSRLRPGPNSSPGEVATPYRAALYVGSYPYSWTDGCASYPSSAELGAYGTLDVIGVGNSPSRGLRKGVVINIEATVSALCVANCGKTRLGSASSFAA